MTVLMTTPPFVAKLVCHETALRVEVIRSWASAKKQKKNRPVITFISAMGGGGGGGVDWLVFNGKERMKTTGQQTNDSVVFM